MNTKAILFATVSLCALAAMAGPARAQVVEPSPFDPSVVVTATVTKTQDITVTETITKNKTVTVTVHSVPVLDGAAEAAAVANQTNDGITVDIQLTDPTVTDGGLLQQDGLQRTGAITGSINSNTGIVGVTQDVGDFANQANLVSFALTNTLGTNTAAPNRGSVADAKAMAEQENENSSSTDIETFVATANRRDLSITGSVNSNTGIVGVNQNAGNANNQLNAVALAVGQGAAVALSEAALGQENSDITVIEVGTTRSETITASVDNNTGITQVNQSNGNFNNQGSVVSFAALTSSVSLGSNTFKP
jgi:hypothetical protein